MKRFSKCYPLDSSYSLVMPNNYIIGSDTDSEEVILKKIASARETLKQIVGEILRKERVYRVHEGAMAGVKSYAANAGFNRFCPKRQALLCHGPLQRLRPVRATLPGIRHLP